MNESPLTSPAEHASDRERVEALTCWFFEMAKRLDPQVDEVYYRRRNLEHIKRLCRHFDDDAIMMRAQRMFQRKADPSDPLMAEPTPKFLSQHWTMFDRVYRQQAERRLGMSRRERGPHDKRDIGGAAAIASVVAATEVLEWWPHDHRDIGGAAAVAAIKANMEVIEA